MGHRVLVVDDDAAFAESLSDYLAAEGLESATCLEADLLEDRMAAFRPEVLLLDQRLGRVTGTEVLRRLRRESEVPVIIVTGRSEPTDRIINLELGADDEVEKTASPREILARIRSVLRRHLRPAAAAPAPATGWRLDAPRRQLLRPDGSEVRLTTAEFDMLLALHAASPEPVARPVLSERVFRRAWEPADRAVDTIVTKLRQKLEPDPRRPVVIRTVRPVGYLFAGFAAGMPPHHSKE